jgi:MoaA/NifB/PqqE/SkfB family radical SAM enzyme
MPERSAEDSHATKGLLRLTMACNERCPFCNVPMEDYAVRTPPVAEHEALLDAFVAAGQQTVTISGGEPTLLRKRLLALVASARSRGVELVEVQTNAVLIDADYANALAAGGVTSAFVSLLSHIAAHHDALAGLDGAFERCLAGIDALLDAGIRVALNPVIATPTQRLVADYIDFVAERLPRVRSVSLSAVQPHGRAVHHLELLPDYAVLADEVPRARARAVAHGIELLNPFCGLPLCVGWADGLERSVEAQEALLPDADGPVGIDNAGHKRHGPQCHRCALHARCGGAWHAYWDVRGGSGLVPPTVLVPPWREGAGADAPAVWADRLDADATDVGLVFDADDLDADVLRAVREHLERPVDVPQHRVQVHVALRGSDPRTLDRAVGLLAAIGLRAVDLIGDVDGRLPGALSRAWHIEVT